MHIMSVHSRAAELRQKSRMDIDGLPGIKTLCELEPAGKHHEMSPRLLDELLVLLAGPWTGEVVEGYAEPICLCMDASVQMIADNANDGGLEAVLPRTFDEVFETRTAPGGRARGEYEYVWSMHMCMELLV